ncbi:30S ribosomal protein S3 [Candidatus Micrarchaeota archaeon]|nr:30S ribosomal protein S3 [Candidatus Micrarchaeota archaeon]MBU2476123.1 30S ribosomal protein S3 [Candidatus Micrarchaeota archaeon]
MIERTFIKQGTKKIEIEDYLKKELDKAGFTKLETMKTPLVTRVVLNVTKPGLAIGKGGTNIKKLTKTLEEKFGVENPQIEIKEITVPELDAQAMANKISMLIGRGFSWRSVVYRTMKDITSAGAQGVEIVLAGALGGKGVRKRKQRIAEGYMKKIGEQAKLVDYGAAPARAKFGVIGVKVRIVKPGTVFPDKINIKEKIESRKEKKAEEEKENEEKKEIKENEKKEAKKEHSKKEDKKEKEEDKRKKEAKEETKKETITEKEKEAKENKEKTAEKKELKEEKEHAKKDSKKEKEENKKESE